MKTKFIIKLNLLLAALITLLMGCKSQQVNKSDNDVVADDDIVEAQPAPERMICLYGIPPEVYQRLHPEDSTNVN